MFTTAVATYAAYGTYKMSRTYIDSMRDTSIMEQLPAKSEGVEVFHLKNADKLDKYVGLRPKQFIEKNHPFFLAESFILSENKTPIVFSNWRLLDQNQQTYRPYPYLWWSTWPDKQCNPLNV